MFNIRLSSILANEFCFTQNMITHSFYLSDMKNKRHTFDCVIACYFCGFLENTDDDDIIGRYLGDTSPSGQLVHQCCFRWNIRDRARYLANSSPYLTDERYEYFKNELMNKHFIQDKYLYPLTILCIKKL